MTETMPSFQFVKAFELQSDLRFPVPSKLSEKVAEVLGKGGLYKIYIQQLIGDAYDPVNEIVFPEVKSSSDTPNLESEFIVQLILAVIYEHNLRFRRQLKYRCRFLSKSDEGGPKQTYNEFFVNAIHFFQQEDDEAPVSDPAPQQPMHAPYAPVGGALDFSQHLETPAMMVMAQVASLFSETRLILAEQRTDLSRAREQVSDLQDKLGEVITANLTHTENQTKVNETGWQALHKGVELQAKSQEREWKFQQVIDELNKKIMLLEFEKNSQQNAQPGIIQQLLPILTMGLVARGVVPPGVMNMLKEMVPGLMPGDEDEEDEDEDESSEPPTQQGPLTVEQLDQLTLRDVTRNEAEARKHPIRSMARLLNRMIAPHERAQIKQVLSPLQWASLKRVLAGTNDQECAMALMELVSKIDDTTKNRLMAILRPRPRRLLNSLGSFIQAKFQGKKPGIPSDAMSAGPAQPQPEPEDDPEEPETLARVPGTVYCGRCGQANPKGFRFCGGCGGAFPSRPQSLDDRGPIAAPPSPPSRPPAPVPTPEAPPPPPPPPPPAPAAPPIIEAQAEAAPSEDGPTDEPEDGPLEDETTSAPDPEKDPEPEEGEPSKKKASKRKSKRARKKRAKKPD